MNRRRLQILLNDIYSNAYFYFIIKSISRQRTYFLFIICMNCKIKKIIRPLCRNGEKGIKWNKKQESNLKLLSAIPY